MGEGEEEKGLATHCTVLGIWAHTQDGANDRCLPAVWGARTT